MRVLVMEGKVSAAAATIDCSSFHQHMASVFGIHASKGPGVLTGSKPPWNAIAGSDAAYLKAKVGC